MAARRDLESDEENHGCPLTLGLTRWRMEIARGCRRAMRRKARQVPSPLLSRAVLILPAAAPIAASPHYSFSCS